MNVLTSIKKAAASFSLMSLLLTVAGASLFTVNVANAAFTDQAEIPSWADEAVEELVDMGVISGNDDGSFAPAQTMNRAELTKVIVEATGVSCTPSATPTFPDVQPGAWYYDYVQCAADMGWVNGYPDGMFRPAVTVNRAEFAKIVTNAFQIDQDLTGAPHFTDVASSDWFYNYVETAFNAGVMQGYTASTFSPASMVTRAEMARVIYDAILYTIGGGEGVDPGVTGATADGTLEIMISTQTPAGTSIPFNATSVPFTTLEATAAADADVQIGAMTFTRAGLSDNDAFDNCWLEIDGFKVGSSKSVTTDDLVNLTFNPAIVVPAGQTMMMDLVCSLEYSNTVNTGSSAASLDDRNIGQRNRFMLVSADDILSTAINVIGAFPIEGEEMDIADYAVSEIEFTDLGSDTTVQVGDFATQIGKFRLLNDSATGKDLELRAITFENDGDSDLEESLFDTVLMVGSTQVSTATIVDGDYITFIMGEPGYILEDGDSRVFSINSDIVTAENGDYIQFKVDNFEDIVAIEIGTSFGVRAVDENGNNAEDQYATLKKYSIDSGDLSLSRDVSSPGTEEYAPGSNEVVALVARAIVGQPMTFDGLQFRVQTGSFVKSKDGDAIDSELVDFNDAFDNFRLYVDDQLIDTQDDIRLLNGGTDGVVSNYVVEFDTQFELSTTSIIRLVADIEDGADTGDQIKFQIVANGDFDSPEYLITGDTVPTTELLGAATSSFIKVELSQLIISKTDGFSNNDYIVAGEDNLNVMEFTLTNNESGDVNVTSIDIGLFGPSASGTTNVCSNYTMQLFLEGVPVGSARTPNSNCVATFNDISGVVVPSGEEKEFTLVLGTIESSASTVVNTITISGPLQGLSLARDIGGGSIGNPSPDYACISMTAAQAVLVSPGVTLSLVDNSGDYDDRQIVGIANDAAGVPVAGNHTFLDTAVAPATFIPAGWAPVTTVAATCPAGSYAILTQDINSNAVNGDVRDNWDDTYLIADNAGMVNIGFDYLGLQVNPQGVTAGPLDMCTFTDAATMTYTVLRPSTPAITTPATPAFVGDSITGVTTGIAAGWFPVYVSSTTGFQPGEAVSVTGLTSAEPIVIAAVDVTNSLIWVKAQNHVTGSAVLDAECGTIATPGTHAGTYAGATNDDLIIASNFGTGTVTSIASGNGIGFAVVGVDADNVENGQSVDTFEGGYVLTGAQPLSGQPNSACPGGFTIPVTNTSNFLCGAFYNLIESGKLNVDAGGNTIYTDILVADETEVEVFEIRFDAAYDEIHVTDLYLENDVYVYGTNTAGANTPIVYGTNAYESNGTSTLVNTVGATPTTGGETRNNIESEYTEASERFKFKLYSSAGVLIDSADMQADGTLHFSFDNNPIIVPKDGDASVTVRVDVYNINGAADTTCGLSASGNCGETGMRLKLSLDTDHVNGYEGVEAITSATGDDINVNSSLQGGMYEVADGAVTSDDFVAYRTEIIVAHAPSQITNFSPSTGVVGGEIYRFTLTADGAHEAYVARASFDVRLNGFTTVAIPLAADFKVFEVQGGSIDESTPYDATVTPYAYGASSGAATTAEFRAQVDFNTIVQLNSSSTQPKTKTFALYLVGTADLAAPAADSQDDYIQVAIPDDNQYHIPADLATLQTALDTDYSVTPAIAGTDLFAIVWSDAADPSHTALTEDWMNGYAVEVSKTSIPVGEY